MDSGVFAGWAALAFLLGLVIPALRPDWITGRPFAVLFILGAVTAATPAALYRADPPGLRLQIDPSTEPLLPAGDPGQFLYESAVLDFGDDEVFVIAIECGEIFTFDCLSSIDRVTTTIARLDLVRTVSSLMDVTSFRWVAEEEWVEVRPFMEEVPTDPVRLSDLRHRALTDPVYRRTIVSEDSKAAAINVTFRKMSDAEFIESGLDDQILEIIRRETTADRRFYVAGRPHLKVHVYRGMLRDMTALIPLGVAVMAIVLWFVTGAKRTVIIPIGTSLIAILWVFSAMAATGKSLTILTGLLAPMLLAIGSVYGIHVISRYEEEADGADSSREAAESALRHLIVPVVIAGLTTIVGFAALLITDVPAVRELGLFSMLGIASITVLSLTGIPATLSLMPLRTSPAMSLAAGPGDAIHKRVSRAFDRQLVLILSALSAWVARWAREIIFASAIIGLGAALAIPNIVIDTDYLSYFDERDPVRRDFEAVNRLLAGAIPIYVVLDGSESGEFREPATLELMKTLKAQLDELDGVSRTLTSIDSLQILNRAFAADDPAAERIPATRPGVSELLFMMPKADLSKFMTVNHSRANMVVRTGEVGSAAIKSLTERIEQRVAAIPWPESITWGVTGNTILLARSADGIARSQPQSVAVAALTIFLLIAGGLRSVGLGAIAMVPNLLPVLVFFGLLGLGIAPLSLPTSLIGSVALGIAIDDSVHFMVRYRSERQSGADPVEAAARCGRRIGRPIAITSVVITLGFLVVAFSEFATLREFGYLSAATMVICLMTDLILLPALLIRAKI